jgi:hypothetical protein
LLVYANLEKIMCWSGETQAESSKIYQMKWKRKSGQGGKGQNTQNKVRGMYRYKLAGFCWLNVIKLGFRQQYVQLRAENGGGRGSTDESFIFKDEENLGGKSSALHKNNRPKRKRKPTSQTLGKRRCQSEISGSQ